MLVLETNYSFIINIAFKYMDKIFLKIFTMCVRPKIECVSTASSTHLKQHRNPGKVLGNVTGYETGETPLDWPR